ncbi:hypothetical protein JF50_21735 [Pseudoalteromonas luteoviolacea]|uniref:Uncharacterized protein n=1 Tax=Pseudoalteromonas luteoviolacea TaxID=43657 RepID=A0A0C1Q4Y0_9GAMM|nr:hypothetical protein [Pseudoalteromonas luteoviolacea]KID54550.1 hypothetical protein JF50_21735 [Pseudoalteromonas luteoviolacea]
MYGKLLATSVAVAAALAHSSAFALPDATSGNPLSSIGVYSPAGIGDVVRDHKDDRTLYVGPANSKEIIGTYYEIGGGPSCSSYVNMKTQLHNLPVSPVKVKQALDNDEFYSNYFQLTVAIPAKNLKIAKDIGTKYNEIVDLATENKSIIDQYRVLHTTWLGLVNEKGTIDKEIDSLRLDQSEATNKCIVLHGTNPTEMIACMTREINYYSPLISAAKAQSDMFAAELDKIRLEYYEAKGLYDAFTDKLDRLKTQLEFNTNLYGFQSLIANNAYDFEKKTVDEAGSLIAGTASAGYNVFDNEAAILTNALTRAGKHGYDVKQLDIFDIRLNSGVTKENINIVTANQAPLYRKNVWSYPANTVINFGNIGDRATPFERETVGDQIHFDTTTWDSLRAGDISFNVTKDARCGAYAENSARSYTYTDNNGIKDSWTIVTDEYRANDNDAVFAANIALSYNYYAYPGKIEGECSIDVDRMHSYWRNTGKSKGWSWFRSKTRSWDHIRETARDNLGMECSLSAVPESNNPEEARAMVQELESQLYTDMWQMFLATYAESYDLVVSDPEVTDAGDSTVGAQLGDGLNKVCPASKVCQFANVVLRVLDTIGGSKAQGTTSHVSNTYGKIWRRYEKETFNVYQGSALIKAKVCVNENQCN